MKDNAIQIHVSRATKEHWEDAAARLDISVSSFCRLMVAKGEKLTNLENDLIGLLRDSLSREDRLSNLRGA